MSFLRVALAGLVVAMLAGCASDDSGQVFSAFDEDTFQAWQGPGRSNLLGQGFYKMPSGRLISCAGSEVLLLPANGYNIESLQTITSGKGFPANYNKAAYRHVRRTVCDGSGKFAFPNLPTQNWIVLIHLTWQEPSTTLFWTKNDKGGWLYLVTTPELGDTKLVLANQEFVADQD